MPQAGFENTQHVPSAAELIEYESRSIHDRPVRNMLCSCVYTEDGDLVGLIQVCEVEHICMPLFALSFSVCVRASVRGSHKSQLAQAINKKHGVFTMADEKLVQTLASQAGVMLHHSQLLITMQKQVGFGADAKRSLCGLLARLNFWPLASCFRASLLLGFRFCTIPYCPLP